MGHDDKARIEPDDSTRKNAVPDGMGCEDLQRGKPTIEKTKKKATAAELKQLLERQQYCCALSGLPLTPDDSALDHIVSVSDGGTHEINNLQWLNVDVNRMKGSMTQSRFLSIVRMIADNEKNGKVLR